MNFLRRFFSWLCASQIFWIECCLHTNDVVFILTISHGRSNKMSAKGIIGKWVRECCSIWRFFGFAIDLLVFRCTHSRSTKTRLHHYYSLALISITIHVTPWPYFFSNSVSFFFLLLHSLLFLHPIFQVKWKHFFALHSTHSINHNLIIRQLFNLKPEKFHFFKQMRLNIHHTWKTTKKTIETKIKLN